MEELEGFLMQDDEEELNNRPENLSIGNHLNFRVNDWWDDELMDLGGFDSNILTLLEEDEFLMQPKLPIGFTNNEEEFNFLPCQHLQQQQQQQQQEQVDEEEGEELGVEREDKNPNEGSSKNFVSERNRRKRLNGQLFKLRSLVPNITKMDKQSILVDALAHLQTTLQQIEKEMEKNEPSLVKNSSCSTSSLVRDEDPLVQTQQFYGCAVLPVISQVECEMLDKESVMVKIGCNKAMGALGLVQRVIEMLGLDITCISVSEHNQDNMLTTAFLRVSLAATWTKYICTPTGWFKGQQLNNNDDNNGFLQPTFEHVRSFE